jgi:CheY-like chemotaxis protein
MSCVNDKAHQGGGLICRRATALLRAGYSSASGYGGAFAHITLDRGNWKTEVYACFFGCAILLRDMSIFRPSDVTLLQLTMMKVLVVNDSAVDAATTIKAVRHVSTKYDTVTAIDTDHAIELMACTTFDLVLLDLNMPRMDGMDLLRQMRQGAAALTDVIAVSSSRSMSAQTKAASLGIVDFVYKSDNLDEFAAQLNAAMSKISKTTT